MIEFRSKLEEMVPTEELNFDPTPAFGLYRRFFPKEASAHPAKANTKLIEFLIKEFTKKGDTILDPMAGTGSTCVIAALHGRNAICVDIEERFVEWMEEAKRIVEKTPLLARKGEITVIQGDARNLSEILSSVDVVVTSPPYTNQAAEDLKNLARYRKGGMFAEEKLVKIIITSPPYAESVNAPNDPKRRAERLRRAGYDPREYLGGRARCNQIDWRYSGNIENIGNLSYGDIDAIITSPPYSETLTDKRKGYTKIGSLEYTRQYHTGNPDNIGNLLHGDSESLIKSRGRDIEILIKRLMKDSKPTYLSEMLKVYWECFKVLKPGGLAIIIVKPFIRNKKVVDLPYHTWLLMEKAGFRLEKLYKLRLKQHSFWRILYYRKHPEVPRINHEYIIVTRK